MVEPITGAVVAKAMGKNSPETQRAISNLMIRLFGPSADAIGEALGRYTSYRLRNVGRIAERADFKSDSDNQSAANPRVAHVLLDEGSYCDDEVMIDYLGGLLAASRTPSGRDDRAATWSSLVTSLSSLQIRAHYLLYREWAARLHDVGSINLGLDSGRKVAQMNVKLEEFITCLLVGDEMESQAALTHAVPGLFRVGLLGGSYRYGAKGAVAAPTSEFEFLLVVEPSAAGMELYGWAQGLPGLNPHEFTSKAAVFNPETPIPRIEGIELPLLPKSDPKATE